MHLYPYTKHDCTFYYIVVQPQTYVQSVSSLFFLFSDHPELSVALNVSQEH